MRALISYMADEFGTVRDAVASGVPFALLYRPGTDAGNVELLRGDVRPLTTLDELAVLTEDADVLALLPYRQLTERGLSCIDDGAPLLALTVSARASVGRELVLERLPSGPIDWSSFSFDVDDSGYRDIVARVMADEIGTGEGSNFVIARSLVGTFADPLPDALRLFRRLLADEQDAYWTFLVYTGSQCFVGATPEAHVGLRNDAAFMNPISGTYRYPESGVTATGLREFLVDQKEIDELFMVVDEELKMMSRVCPSGGLVSGPRLKAMSHLAHTEYHIHGTTTLSPTTLLRETMFAPTVVGSPLENATRVIARHETCGRGYYSGVIAFIERRPGRGHEMDSAIVIRTAVVEATGEVRITVGSTLVRDSQPQREADETRAKAAALVGTDRGRPRRLRLPTAVTDAVAHRNALASPFWLDPTTRCAGWAGVARGKRALLIEAEDDFTAMLATMLKALGLHVTIVPAISELQFDSDDLVIFGPGPGDPTSPDNPRVAALQTRLGEALDAGVPFLAVCLSHQILCNSILGLAIRRLERPNQGTGRDIELFGRQVRVGFYNTFVAHSTTDVVTVPHGYPVQISRDRRSGEVYALRGERFESFQFHAESVLSGDGWSVLSETLCRLVLESADAETVDRRRPSKARVCR